MSQLVAIKEKFDNVRTLLTKRRAEIAKALPRHISSERMVRLVLNSIQKTPALLDCSQALLLAAVLQSAALGLEPDTPLGHAYLIPYGKDCKFIPGYKGLIHLAVQSGKVVSVVPRVVRQHDQFEFEYGATERLRHVPNLEHADDQITFAYCVARLVDGAVQFDVMSAKQINAIRDRSAAGKRGPWVTDWEEMAKKTVVRRLCKVLPASPELQTAVALDELAESGLPQHLEAQFHAEVPAEPAQGSALDQVVTKERGKVQPIKERTPGEDDDEPPPDEVA